jgi:hypothetical protein
MVPAGNLTLVKQESDKSKGKRSSTPQLSLKTLNGSALMKQSS